MKKCIYVICLVLLGSMGICGQTIRITSPAAGANWCLGSTQTITWTKSGAMQATVAIRLRLAGAPSADPVLVIADGTANDGSYSWTIPNSVAPGDYLIRVRTDDSAVVGDSGTFTIAPALPPPADYPMTFTNPARGATLCSGRSYAISWNRGSVTDSRVRISLLTQSSSPELSLNEVIANSGIYNWTVPASILGGPHILRLEPPVEDPMAPRVLAESPVFQISHCYSVRPTLAYSGPNHVEVCFELATIAWSSSGDPIRSVHIDFLCRTLPGGIFRLASSAPNTGSARVRMPRVLLDAIRDHGGFAGTPRISSAADPDITSDSSIYIEFIRCRPTDEELARDLVLNPVDQLYLPAALVSDPKCGSCVDFDLGKIKAVLGDPSQPLSMTLFHAGRKVAELGYIGGGKTPPDQVRESLAPEAYKMFFENLQEFAIILKTLEGKEVAKIRTEVIIQK